MSKKFKLKKSLMKDSFYVIAAHPMYPEKEDKENDVMYYNKQDKELKHNLLDATKYDTFNDALESEELSLIKSQPDVIAGFTILKVSLKVTSL